MYLCTMPYVFHLVWAILEYVNVEKILAYLCYEFNKIQTNYSKMFFLSGESPKSYTIDYLHPLSNASDFKEVILRFNLPQYMQQLITLYEDNTHKFKQYSALNFLGGYKWSLSAH